MKKLLFTTLMALSFYISNGQTAVSEYLFTSSSLQNSGSNTNALTQTGSALTFATSIDDLQNSSVSLNGDALNNPAYTTHSSGGWNNNTIAFWMKTTDNSSGAKEVINHFSDHGWEMTLEDGNLSIHGQFWATGEPSWDQPDPFNYTYNNIADGYWHFVVLLLEKSIAPAGAVATYQRVRYKVYIDNQLMVNERKQKIVSAGGHFAIPGSTDLVIGDNKDFNGNRYTGMIDDVRYYDGLLSITDIADLYEEYVDLIAPTVLTQEVVLQLGASSSVSITPEDIDNGSYDEHSPVDSLTYGLDVTTFTSTEVGANTVNLTVTDKAGNAASAPAIVTVNATPTIANPLADVVLPESDSTETILLTNVFSDSNGDSLTYSAISSNTGIATVTTNGDTLNVLFVAMGTTDITVTATDSTGAQVSDEFNVVINGAPTIDNPIANQHLVNGFGTYSIDLENAYSDPEGGIITVSASSSNPSVVSTAINDGTLVLTQENNSPASASIMLTVEDQNDNVTLDTFLLVILDNQIYVDASASGNNDGSSWANAYTSLQDGIDAANAHNDIDTVWVAQGVYTSHASDRSVYFELHDNVHLLGGFNGTETDANERDWNNNLTILSGDLQGNDNSNIDYSEATRSDNSYRIVYVSGDSTLIDGFTITSGQANHSSNADFQKGAAIFKAPGVHYLTLKNSTIKNNVSNRDGAIRMGFNSGSNNELNVLSCKFHHNFGRYASGMGVFAESGSQLDVNIYNSLFYKNTATNISGNDGLSGSSFAVFSNSGSTIHVIAVNNTFTQNSDFGTGTTNEKGTVVLRRYANWNNTVSLGDLHAYFHNNIFYQNYRAPAVINQEAIGRMNLTGSKINTLEFTHNVSNQSNFADIASSPVVTDTLQRNPLFADALANDYTLHSTSPAINNGDNNSIAIAVETDLAGNIRVYDNTVDMGAYEFGSTPPNYIPPTVITQGATLALDANGHAILEVSQVDDGSSDDDTPTNDLVFELSKTDFDCADVGSNTVTLTVQDASGNSASATTIVTIEDAIAPTVNTQNLALTLDTNGEASITAEDIDNGTFDNCSFTLTASQENFNTTHVGENLITLTATDASGNSASEQANVVINQAPEMAKNIPDTLLPEDFGSLAINLNSFFADTPGDTLNYSATLSNAAFFSINLLDSVLTIAELSPGTAQVAVTATDSLGAQITDSFTVTVNEKPEVLNPIPDEELVEGFGQKTIDLRNTFTDAEGDAMTLMAESGNQAIVGVQIIDTLLSITENGLGNTWVVVTAQDTVGGFVRDTFNITVNANQLPIVANPISDVLLEEGFNTKTIDISNVFTDADGHSLTYQVNADNSNVVSASISANSIILTETGAGTAMVIASASDGIGTAVTDTFEVIVNAPPIVQNPVADIQLNEGFSSHVIDISSVFSDVNNTDLSFTVNALNSNVVSVSLSNAQLTLSEQAPGNVDIVITATDIYQASVSDTFNVFVNANPTVSNPIADQSFTEGFGSQTMDLTNVFSDADGDALTLTAVSDNESVATATISGNTLTITEVATGTANITVTASDGNGGTADNTFRVTINAQGNTAPVVDNPIADQSFTEGFSSETMDLTNVFNDADGDALTLTAVSDNESVATATISGNTLTITEVATGTANITVTASDGNGGTADNTFRVTINAQGNTAPVVDNPIADQSFTEGFGSQTMDLTNVFSDADGDALTLTAISDNESVATATISGNTLTITEVATGTANITVTADDDNGNSVSDEFSIEITEITSIHADAVDEVTIYPNPTNSELNIEVAEGSNVQVINLKGQILMVKPLIDQKLDVSSLASGVYILTIKNNNNYYKTRFIKR